MSGGGAATVQICARRQNGVATVGRHRMLVKFSVVVPASRQAAYAYIANFVNIPHWDPGVKSSKQARGTGHARGGSCLCGRQAE